MKRDPKSFLPFFAYAILVAWLSACMYQCLSVPAEPVAEPAIVEAVGSESSQLLDMRASLRELTKASVEAASPEGAASLSLEDPYDGWENWCEPHQDTLCQSDADCEGVEHPVNRKLRCVHSWRYKSSDVKICAAGYSSKTEREWRINRLRDLVGEYFDEDEHCKEGVGIGKQHWRCQRPWRMAETLTKFLRLVAMRETTYRPWKRHRLNPDQSANERAYVRQAGRYGIEVKTVCANGKDRCKNDLKVISSVTPADPDFNSHYKDMWRWQYGLGMYGEVAALHVASWDPMAPPEVLCREFPATEAYRRSMISNFKKLQSGVSCKRGTPDEHVH